MNGAPSQLQKHRQPRHRLPITPPAAGCQIHQDGDFGELAATFDAADFDEVAEIMRP